MSSLRSLFRLSGRIYALSRVSPQTVFESSQRITPVLQNYRPQFCENTRFKGSRPYTTTAGDEVTDDAEDDILYKGIEVEVKGHEPAVLKSYEQFVTMAARELEVNLDEVLTPKRVRLMRTLLKSAHVYKKHRVQYEMRTHFKVFKIKRITGSTADTFLEYIQRNLPEGVAMKVTKHQILGIPSHWKPPSQSQTEATSS